MKLSFIFLKVQEQFSTIKNIFECKSSVMVTVWKDIMVESYFRALFYEILLARIRSIPPLQSFQWRTLYIVSSPASSYGKSCAGLAANVWMLVKKKWMHQSFILIHFCNPLFLQILNIKDKRVKSLLFFF